MEVALAALAGLLHPRRREDADLLAINRRMARSVGLDGYERQLGTAISRPDSRPLLGSIQAPTLVLVGDSDPLTPVAHSQEIAGAVRGASLEVVPDCGHLSPIERPQQVSETLRRWAIG